MKLHFLSVVPILFPHIAFGAPNDVPPFHELEANVVPGLLLRRDIFCGKGWHTCDVFYCVPNGYNCCHGHTHSCPKASTCCEGACCDSGYFCCEFGNNACCPNGTICVNDAEGMTKCHSP